MTLKSIDEVVTMLAEAFGQKVTPIRLMAYDAGLSDVPLASLNAAVVRAVRESRFMPAVAELRDLCGVASGRIDAKDRPLLAWQAVRGAISKVGAYDSLAFDDAAINATIRELGGWPLLCDTPMDEMHWLEKRFCATYSALCSVKLPSDQTERLAGITEISNGREGYASEPIPVAHIRCLTSPNVAGEPITRWLEQREVPKLTGPHIASEKLAERRLGSDGKDCSPPARLAGSQRSETAAG